MTTASASSASTAALCGHYGVPVALITGDEATCREGHELLGDKPARRRGQEGLVAIFGANIPPVRARQMIEEGVADSAEQSRKWPKPYVPKKPTTITIDLSDGGHAPTNS